MELVISFFDSGTIIYVIFNSIIVCIIPRYKICRAAVYVVAVLWIRQPNEDSSGLLRVTFLDVGHGDATVIQFPQGEVMLIDSGGLRSNQFDTGKLIVAPALRALNIRRVNWLMISHPHHDHMAGMSYVLNHFRPVKLLAPMAEVPYAYRRLIVG